MVQWKNGVHVRISRTERGTSVEKWSEGPAADPEAARERYTSDMRAERKALREVIGADLPAAHLGLGIVVIATVLVSLGAGPAGGALVAGVFGLLFVGALAAMFLRGVRGLEAGRRACLFTFGWANWV
ncbi:hypothetical protein OIE77_39165 [Streptomyces sp. NBC_01715]|uniref:hypothetical protein n=2 Tax=Streptomyces TaxID=1883 RepID=UPI002E373B02|nr:hypothetical protein [Streptomyces sp. NBC_01715]